MWTLRNTQDGFTLYEAADKTPFGYYANDWYSLAGQNPQPPHMEAEHSPEWGSSWDGWTAMFLLNYLRLNGGGTIDGFVSTRYELIRNGFVKQEWQPTTGPLRGMFW